MVGETLGSYTIIGRLGAGGMGEVYLAQHTRIDRRAAIKLLLPEYSTNPEVVDRFFAEARATSSIHHHGIVEVFDCDVHASGRAYIVMELLEGESLGARLARDVGFGGDIPRALALVAEIADAVGAAHAKGIVHRDLKPDNVFLSTAPDSPFGFRAKILDFGIAKLIGRDTEGDGRSSSRTRTGSLLGTPAYMSPEQCRGASRVDHRTDIYSLGCIFFEVLAGRVPFAYEGFGELIQAHMSEPAPSLASLAIVVPPDVEALVAAMLAKSPDERPASMPEVVAQASAVRRRLEAGGFVPVAGGTQRGTRPGGGVTQTTLSEQAAEQVKPAHGNRRGLGLAAVGLAGAAILAGLFMMMRRPASAPGAKSASTLAAGRVPLAGDGHVVRLEVADAPPGITVEVDGRSATLPLELPAGAREHALVFRAPGYRPRELRVDGSMNRLVTLAMESVAPLGHVVGAAVDQGRGGAPPPPAKAATSAEVPRPSNARKAAPSSPAHAAPARRSPTPAARKAISPPSAAAPATSPAAARPAAPPTARPAARPAQGPDLSDDARKL